MFIIYNIQLIFIILIILIIYIILQVRADLGIADHIWQDKRIAIAQTVDNLDDQFRPAMRAGWLKYFRNAYPEGAETAQIAVGGDTLVLDDWVNPSLLETGIPCDGAGDWHDLWNEYQPKHHFCFCHNGYNEENN